MIERLYRKPLIGLVGLTVGFLTQPLGHTAYKLLELGFGAAAPEHTKPSTKGRRDPSRRPVPQLPSEIGRCDGWTHGPVGWARQARVPTAAVMRANCAPVTSDFSIRWKWGWLAPDRMYCQR